MNSLTVKVLTAFIVTTGLMLMWTPVGKGRRNSLWLYQCTDDQTNKSRTDLNEESVLWKCLVDVYGSRYMNAVFPDVMIGICCASYELYCIEQHVYKSNGCTIRDPDSPFRDLVKTCKRKFSEEVSADFCAKQQPYSQNMSRLSGECKKHIPCYPDKPPGGAIIVTTTANTNGPIVVSDPTITANTNEPIVVSDPTITANTNGSIVVSDPTTTANTNVSIVVSEPTTTANTNGPIVVSEPTTTANTNGSIVVSEPTITAITTNTNVDIKPGPGSGGPKTTPKSSAIGVTAPAMTIAITLAGIALIVYA